MCRATTAAISALSCTRIFKTDTQQTTAAGATTRVAWLRWVFLVLTFAVTMVGYADRQVLGLLKPVLDQRFGWTGADYGAMTTAFQIAIAAALLGAGWFMDRVGLRWGFAAGLGGWSVASILHAAARTVPQFIAARAALGVFEAVGTPAGMKAVATFFRPNERTLVIGVGNMAPNIAAMLTPLVVSALYVRIGWQGTIITLGSAGLVCLGFWLALPLRRMVDVSAEQAILAAPPATLLVLRDRTAWALAAAKFLTDQGWWFLLFWLPDFFHRRFHLDMRDIGLPVATVYAMAALGSLSGGGLPALLARCGLSRAGAMWLAMAIFAGCVLPIVLILHVGGLWPSVLVVGLALAGHQGFATNIFGIAAAAFPASRIASAAGLGAFAGNCGGALSLYAAGRLIPAYGLQPSFWAVAAGYPLAWVVLRMALGNRGKA
jgi:ACS family hexuronate transporter-like MFS transporter